MNVPNSITVARVGMVPVFVWLAYGDTTGAAYGALTMFVVASLSDFVDGYLARRNGQVTRLGQFLDPLADKALVGAALYALVDTRAFPLWAALVIAAREVIVQVLRTRVVGQGGTMPASAMAKLKTILQLCMVSWWLLPWNDTNAGHWVLMYAALSYTVVSGAGYMMQARPAGGAPA